MTRVGIAYDIHPLVSGRPLILGGIHIPFDKGLDGDSDADVLTHAIIDAILGALGQGDIGKVFGVGTPEVMGISSLILLEKTYKRMMESGFKIINIDSTIIAETPKLNPHIPAMCDKLSTPLHCSSEAINVKSTTHKKLGFLGTGEAIAVHAIVQIGQ
jgi:2-C-methyl-D-erythritol 2,4-cyclodiphosphate synthase